MTTEIQPLSKSVQNAVRHNKSPVRYMTPLLGKLTHVLMFLLITGGCLAGAGLLWRHALQDSRFHMDGEMLGIGGSVRECPEAVEDIRAIGLRFSGRSVLDPFLVSDLEAAYAENVWVKKVTRLRRHFPNRIDLEFQLRIPAAQVNNNQRYWMVDMDGILLPVPGQPQPFPRLPEIVGVTAKAIASRPQPGEEWRDEGVIGGLGILRAFWGSPLAEALPVQRVVVNTGVFRDSSQMREIRRRFEVVSTNGAVVRWGTYNPENFGDELTSAEKMWNLQELLRRDVALNPGVCFDVRTNLPGFSLIE